MRIRFLLGPAGSGKTFRCLMEIRHHLSLSQEGPPLLLVTPKQTTYQLERQFLEYASIPGYTRLFIFSFERLAHFLFQSLGKQSPDLLDEEGRIMVLRGLLTRNRDRLKLFRASSKLTGFAQQLSLVLRDLQRQQVTPATLKAVAGKLSAQSSLALKLEDLALLLERYTTWLQDHNLQDADCLLNAVAEALNQARTPSVWPKSRGAGETQMLRPAEKGMRGRKGKAIPSDQLVLAFDSTPTPDISSPNGGDQGTVAGASVKIAGLWVDGFGEFSSQEIDFLAALAPGCEAATITFCLDREPARRGSWLSPWSAVQRSFEEVRKRLDEIPGIQTQVDLLERQTIGGSRFADNPPLRHLEKNWEQPVPFDLAAEKTTAIHVAEAVRIVTCENPESEAIFAAREILRHARRGGRFRDVTVLTRKLDLYHGPLQRTFARYGIPFFLDRRQSVAHHPLAELTRSALRTVAFHWQHEDWFAALKTGLMDRADSDIDELENEALARGWKGRAWQEPLRIKEEPRSAAERERLIGLESRLEGLRTQIILPFKTLASALGGNQNRATGPELTSSIREFWEVLAIEKKLEDWAAAESTEPGSTGAVHSTVWNQLNDWLENIDLAFPDEQLSLREWLPILEAGLGQLSVGVIPPALDQVLIGALDRSRNPDTRLAFLLGMNETVFPAAPESSTLLTDGDRSTLEGHNLLPNSTRHYQLGRERFHAYVACTRARERLIMTRSLADAEGSPLNPSPFIAQIQKLFPTLEMETFANPLPWERSEHLNELLVPLLRLRAQTQSREQWPSLANVPGFQSIIAELDEFRDPPTHESLAPELAARLYGPTFHTSVSRLEQFAECPFKFFVHSGLRAEERRTFELDFRERGTFQHDAMALFHQELEKEKKRWRDVTPEQARERMRQIACSLMLTYREGLLQTNEESRFAGQVLSESLQNFVEVLVRWMREQYLFDPVRVELPFGQPGSTPLLLKLPRGQSLALNGRIDRVDIWKDPDTGQHWGVVLDYKSSYKQLDSVLIAHGVQLQLLAYLNVLRQWPDPAAFPEAKEVIPAGVFYVNLRGKYGRSPNRTEGLARPEEERKRAYRHAGRFDIRALGRLDARPGSREGDQFNFRVNQDGSVNKASREVMESEEFAALLDSVEQNLKKMGTEIFSGVVSVSPFRKGSMKACDQCVCQAVCRIDPWEHPFRILAKQR